MIKARGLTKHYGDKVALDDVSFDIAPGRVTGFLGPNGAGKSTSMRLMVGLDRPTAGEVTIAGRPFSQHRAPLAVAGVLLDAKGVHPGRTARSHLRALAATHGISNRRVDQVLGLTGLTPVANRRIGGFSLGMGQRLGIAAALLGDPQVLILDEPVNGLDPDGVLWVRNLVRSQAAEGKTVLLSSHLMSEMAQTADHIIVLGRGRLIADAPVSELLGAGGAQVRVTTPEASRLVHLLRTTRPGQPGDTELTIEVETGGTLLVRGAEARQIGRLCAHEGIELHQLTSVTSSLEDAYLALTRDELEYQTAEPAAA
ncbi:MAG: ABC transporter ATP-binding protein [Actinobacteria bacterium]|nr:ABC transporter ATP-binding protein [Actinomycetota bacterium]